MSFYFGGSPGRDFRSKRAYITWTVILSVGLAVIGIGALVFGQVAGLIPIGLAAVLAGGCWLRLRVGPYPPNRS